MARPRFEWDARDPLSSVWVERLRAIAGERVEFVAGEEGPLFVDDEERYQGAHAIYRALATVPSRRWLLGAYLSFGLFGTLSDALFGFVTNHRRAALIATRVLIGRDVRPTRQVLVRWLFLRMLGVVAACAFASLAAQLDGLLGSKGIEPATELAKQVAEAAQHGMPVYRRHLSLFWLHPTDGTLHALAWGGFAAAIFLVIDVLPAFALLACWACYLSLLTVGNVFLGYQWDALLLETLLCAAFVVPFRIRPQLSGDRPPRRLGIWVLRLLMFKLMLLSGLVKLTSHDPYWKSLTALEFHYWTQPLPASTSAFVASMPSWMHQLACALTLIIEVRVPFLIFGPRRVRWLAALLFIVLQLAIASSGNFGFFNALTIVLAFSLFDDDAIEGLLRLRATVVERVRRLPVEWAYRVLAAAVLIVSATESCARIEGEDALPSAPRKLAEWVAPLQSIHSYGLFAVMTTSRPEIEIEGSADGVHWKPYVFPYKPGPLNRAPRFAPMHLPRLDWQLWFAALGEQCGNVGWYPDLLKRLLEGSPPVRGLLATDPFPDKPPLFLRSTLWDYRFASPEQRQRGLFWTREKPRPFCPTVTLQGGELLPVED